MIGNKRRILAETRRIRKERKGKGIRDLLKKRRENILGSVTTFEEACLENLKTAI